MEVTALMDNDVAPGTQGIVSEHGLSYLVETAGGAVLFDTGATGAFADNAAALGKDISSVKAAVISHHHYDHTGGLERFFGENPHAAVTLKKGPDGNCQFRGLLLVRRDIGMDPGVASRYGHRFQAIDAVTEILPDVFVLPEIDTLHPTPSGNRHLFVVRDGTPRTDDFSHELMMVVRERGALAVFTGCAHRGVLNMVDTARRQFPGEPITAVFGGFHLMGLPMFNAMAGTPAAVAGIGERLMATVEGPVYTGHCTGKKAYQVLKSVMGDRLHYFGSGARVQM